ncbi:MAG: hypothetical protein AABY11_02110, partial [archaeon]
RASFLSSGAAIENMLIEASAEGYRADVVYFPNNDDKWHVADIRLVKDDSIKIDPFAAFIKKRITNRKAYANDPLTNDERKAFLTVAEHGGGNFLLAEKREDINRLGRVGSTNEEVMLANRALHKFFFSHVNWTKEEDEKKKIGFYIKTLELLPPAEAMFKVFRHWSIMRMLGALGFNRIVAKQNGSTNASAAAIGALMIVGTEPLDFVKIGRMIERLWLTATSLGLSFQPLTGVLFFRLKIAAGEGKVFSPREQKLITDAYQEASLICKADGKHIAFMFRVGHGDAPSSHAIRFPLKDVVEAIP